MVRAVHTAITSFEVCLDEGQSPDQSENNINDINMPGILPLNPAESGISRLHLQGCMSYTALDISFKSDNMERDHED